jgi:hypothetical protein
LVSGYGFRSTVNAASRPVSALFVTSNEVLAEKMLHRVGFFLGFVAKKELPCN